MALTPGTRLGVYEVTTQIGAGGMGEVYRATDSNLKRSVAIKVLPASVAGDADRLARFQREAEVLAALNHPNIAAIYGLEKTQDFTALIMELVEGEDLSQRIARAGIPIDEALPIAKQIADALEAAHEQGIIHRDLKPANIKVRSDGTVKVLDFGLAKAMDPAGAASANAMNSPTLSMHATQAGIILGTAAYMAPEQAKGKAVDRRADIWAFGVVLYEMLSGERAFKGDDISETLASVLKDTVAFDALPPGTPPRLRRLLERCLDRDVRMRLRDIGEARVEIANIAAGAPDTALPAMGPAIARRSLVARAAPWAVAGSVGVALITSLLLWAPWRSAPVPAARKLLVSIGADASLPADAVGASAILSPDGTTLAFVAQQTGGTELFIRKLDQLQAAALAGTAGATSPFFSPEGQWIAFFAGGRLKKISVTGGAAIDLCGAQRAQGGTWTNDDTIVFVPNDSGALMRVSAAGGTPQVFGTLSAGAVTQRWPQALPGGKLVLYTEHSLNGSFDGANLVVASLTGGAPKVVVHGGYYGRYVPSEPGSLPRVEREAGHLVYLQQGTLFAVRFDLDRLGAIGQAVPALEGLSASPTGGGGHLAFSSEGTLVYVPGTGTRAAIPMNWMTRDGKTSVLRAAKVDWAYPRFSPDGHKLALQIFDGRQWDIWVYEWAKDTLTQVTFDPGTDRIPVWTPDGRRIVFESDRAQRGIQNLYWVNADGTGEVTRLTNSSEHQFAFSWHPSGKFLAFMVNFEGRSDLMILPMEGDAVRGWTPGKPTVFLTTPGIIHAYPMFSPDGRWIAYRSNESGRSEIYVRPFPGPGGKWRVSTEGGTLPLWSAAAHDLLYVDPAQNKIMAAAYTVVGDAFRVEKAQVWSPTNLTLRGGSSDYPYDLHPDGKRIAITPPPDNGVQDKVVFVFNFADYLQKIAPGSK